MKQGSIVSFEGTPDHLEHPTIIVGFIQSMSCIVKGLIKVKILYFIEQDGSCHIPDACATVTIPLDFLREHTKQSKVVGHEKGDIVYTSHPSDIKYFYVVREDLSLDESRYVKVRSIYAWFKHGFSHSDDINYHSIDYTVLTTFQRFKDL